MTARLPDQATDRAALIFHEAITEAAHHLDTARLIITRHKAEPLPLAARGYLAALIKGCTPEDGEIVPLIRMYAEDAAIAAGLLLAQPIKTLMHSDVWHARQFIRHAIVSIDRAMTAKAEPKKTVARVIRLEAYKAAKGE